MKFKELFSDMLDEEISDDIAPYFKNQVKSSLNEFNSVKNFIDELENKVRAKNDKN